MSVPMPASRPASTVRARDALRLRVIRQVPTLRAKAAPISLGRKVLHHLVLGLPSVRQPPEVNRWRVRNLPNLLAGVPRLLFAWFLGVPTFYGAVYLRKLCADGRVLDYGTADLRMITTAGVNKIVAGLNNSDATTVTGFKFHGFGTGVTGPAVGNTTLGTEATTQYAVDSTRPTGSQTTGADATVYRSVGTFTPDAAYSPTEMGLFSANAAGTLLDRFTFTAVALNGSGDSLQTTVDVTVAAGS